MISSIAHPEITRGNGSVRQAKTGLIEPQGGHENLTGGGGRTHTPKGNQILSLARLPIPPRRRSVSNMRHSPAAGQSKNQPLGSSKNFLHEDRLAEALPGTKKLIEAGRRRCWRRRARFARSGQPLRKNQRWRCHSAFLQIVHWRHYLHFLHSKSRLPPGDRRPARRKRRLIGKPQRLAQPARGRVGIGQRRGHRPGAHASGQPSARILAAGQDAPRSGASPAAPRTFPASI